jgi:hypothetical protein
MRGHVQERKNALVLPVDQSAGYLLIQPDHQLTGWIERLPVMGREEETALCLVLPLTPLAQINIPEDEEA